MGPPPLSCCFCLAPARPSRGPLLPLPLLVGQLLARLPLLPSHTDSLALHSRVLSASFASCPYWPLLSPVRRRQGSLDRWPVPFLRVHNRKRDPSWGPYWMLSACNGSLWSILPLVPLGLTPSLGARGISSPGGPPPQLIPLRRRLRAIKRLDPKIQHHVLREGLGRPRCHRAQRLLKIGV